MIEGQNKFPPEIRNNFDAKMVHFLKGGLASDVRCTNGLDCSLRTVVLSERNASLVLHELGPVRSVLD